MKMSKRARLGLIIAGVAVAIVLLGAGVVYAATQYGANTSAPTSQSTSTSVSSTARKGKGHAAANTNPLAQLMARAIQGTMIVPDTSAPGGYVTDAFYKGQLSAVNTSANQITVQLANGTSQTFTLDAATRIMLGNRAGAIAKLKAGDTVMVLTQQQQGGSAIVQAVYARGAKAAGAGSGTTSTPTPGS